MLVRTWRTAAVPIRYFLRKEYDFKTVELMNAAYRDALRALRLSDRDDPATALVAAKVIELAETGERNRVRLSRAALAAISGKADERARGFADTAAYFEAKARRTRVPETRDRFLDSAKFYRQLGDITPSLPPGYKAPMASGTGRAGRLLNRADECRAIAESMRDANARGALIRLAETYEALAKCAKAQSAA